ncbi:MAG TPA: hypothetical protein VFP54_05970 [Acidimicrobiales bacterium]|nr:hypothetical protein [Acidimicrobiales bacterium]
MTTAGQTRACGPAFLGRNIGGQPGGDPTAATLAAECLRAAASRRHETFVLAGIAVGALLVALLIPLAARRKAADSQFGDRRRHLLGAVAAIAALIALITLAGGAWAVARVAKGSSSPATTAPTVTTSRPRPRPAG